MPDQGRQEWPPIRLGAVILAAGGSSRMGAPKQLLEVEGRTLVARTLDAVTGSLAGPVVLVLGANADIVRPELPNNAVRVVINHDWASGMASSIRSGIEALLSTDPTLDAVLVTPCDQPALSPEMIRRLVELHRSTGLIAAARYCGRMGSPAVFGSGHFGALAALTGDQGARRIINSGKDDIAAADFPELGFDIDTPADFAAWKATRARA